MCLLICFKVMVTQCIRLHAEQWITIIIITINAWVHCRLKYAVVGMQCMASNGDCYISNVCSHFIRIIQDNVIHRNHSHSKDILVCALLIKLNLLCLGIAVPIEWHILEFIWTKRGVKIIICKYYFVSR